MVKKVSVSKDLLIKPTRTTFGIEFLFSKGVFRFSGDSYPENSVDFFQPLLNRITEYLHFPSENLTVEFRVNYFNTSTSKYLFQIMELLAAYQANGHQLDITWYSSGNDDDMLEAWREIMLELDLSFRIEQD